MIDLAAMLIGFVLGVLVYRFFFREPLSKDFLRERRDRMERLAGESS